MRVLGCVLSGLVCVFLLASCGVGLSGRMLESRDRYVACLSGGGDCEAERLAFEAEVLVYEARTGRSGGGSGVGSGVSSWSWGSSWSGGVTNEDLWLQAETERLRRESEARRAALLGR